MLPVEPDNKQKDLLSKQVDFKKKFPPKKFPKVSKNLETFLKKNIEILNY